MEKAKRNYQRKVKSKLVTFYLHEADLLQYANSINFQLFVKAHLRASLNSKKGANNGK